VWLRFILTQHVRDEEFLRSLISTLNCGRYIPKTGYGEFIVEKFIDVFDLLFCWYIKIYQKKVGDSHFWRI
jgi:hypothetical protein